MQVAETILEELEPFASDTYPISDNALGACGEASGCNGASGECACHGDGFVW